MESKQNFDEGNKRDHKLSKRLKKSVNSRIQQKKNEDLTILARINTLLYIRLLVDALKETGVL